MLSGPKASAKPWRASAGRGEATYEYPVNALLERSSGAIRVRIPVDPPFLRYGIQRAPALGRSVSAPV
jgi:hypothetical protein